MSAPEPPAGLDGADLAVAAHVLELYAEVQRASIDEGEVPVNDVMLAEAEVDSCRRVALVLRSMLGADATSFGGWPR